MKPQMLEDSSTSLLKGECSNFLDGDRHGENQTLCLWIMLLKNTGNICNLLFFVSSEFFLEF
jgi:hypothetical protein